MDPVSFFCLVLCVFFFSPRLNCLCDWLTCLFEEILNVCSRNKTHNTGCLQTPMLALLRDNELQRARKGDRYRLTGWSLEDIVLSPGFSLFSGALKWTVIRLWYCGKWTVIRVCYCGSSAWATHWIFTPLLNLKINSPLLCTNSVAWRRPVCRWR